MPNNWPGPTYNRLIETDPQIIKVSMDIMEWGARNAIFPKGTDPNRPGAIHGAPAAPEITIKHV
jgi:hypothetical protein